MRINAKKFKGTNIGVSEQFPEEIESVRKTLYPELKKAKAEGKRAKIVRDKLIIEGQIFYNIIGLKSGPAKHRPGPTRTDRDRP